MPKNENFSAKINILQKKNSLGLSTSTIRKISHPVVLNIFKMNEELGPVFYVDSWFTLNDHIFNFNVLDSLVVN